MSEMIERVAAALWAKHHPDLPFEMVMRLPNHTAFQFAVAHRADVRFVIEQMRVPTLEMRKVCRFEFAEVDWPAMIDAALKD